MTLNPELCFVIEDNGTVIGYALAAINAEDFYQKLQASWLPEMCSKYPLSVSGEDVQSVSHVSFYYLIFSFATHNYTQLYPTCKLHSMKDNSQIMNS